MTLGKLTDQTVLITGASRGIGAATARLLAGEGAHVVVNYRDKAKRAQAVVAEIAASGGSAIAVQADITRATDVDRMFAEVGELAVLVLNASGGLERDVDPDYAYRLNRDAQVDLATKALPLMREGGRIVFVTSHPAHFADTSSESLDTYAPVARSKRAGEDALRAMIPAFTERGIDFVTVSGDMIEGTITATLLERAQPGTIEQRREAAGGLLSVEEFATHVAEAALADIETGQVILAGGPGAWA